MNLLLWRHAEAGEAADPDTADAAALAADLERPLTPRGVKQAERAAAWLDRVLPAGARVLSSPAVRCVQTAERLDRRFKRCDALAPGASVESLLHAARWPDAKEPVLVVGHQPTLGLVAAYLMTGGLDVHHLAPWSVRKGSVWWLRHRPREGRGEVMIVAVRSADGP